MPQQLPSLSDQLGKLVSSFKLERPIVDIITFAEDPNYLGRKLYPSQKEIFREFFNENKDKTYEELLLICGRDSTKTFMASIIACYVAYLWLEIPDPYYLYQGRVDRGKEVHILCVATKEEQATILLDEIKAKINSSPYFKSKIVKINNYEIELLKNLHILAVTSNSSSEVGKTAILVLFDEIGKYGEESGTRDGEEVYDTLTPSVGRFASNRPEYIKRCAGDPGLEMIVRFLGRVVSISTPMGKQGILWRLYNTALRLPSILMYQRPTWEMNPNYPKGCKYLEDQKNKNPRTFNREYGAQFDEAVDFAWPPELVDHCSRPGQVAIDPFLRSEGGYLAAIDTSKRKDAFAFAIGHMKAGLVIIDLVKYWLPVNNKLNWSQVTHDIISYCIFYGIDRILHDGYEGEAVKLYFHDYSLNETPFSVSYKMDIYGCLDDRMWQDQISYPADERLLKEMKAIQKEYNGEKIKWHHPDSGPCTNDDGPDVVANLTYNLYTGYVASHGNDTTEEKHSESPYDELFRNDKKDYGDSMIFGGAMN